jgi:hypothetical protein
MLVVLILGFGYGCIGRGMQMLACSLERMKQRREMKR